MSKLVHITALIFSGNILALAPAHAQFSALFLNAIRKAGGASQNVCSAGIPTGCAPGQRPGEIASPQTTGYPKDLFGNETGPERIEWTTPGMVAPLPNFSKIVTWNPDPKNQTFEMKLQGRFDIIPVEQVAAILPPGFSDPTKLSDEQLDAGLNLLCDKTDAEVVMTGMHFKEISIQRYHWDVGVFSCKSRKAIWSDGMELVTPDLLTTKEEGDRAQVLANNAWADRVLAAEQLGTRPSK